MAKNDKAREELAESRHIETMTLALAALGIAGISLGVAYGVWKGWLFAAIMMTIVIVGWLSLYSIARRNSKRRKDTIKQLNNEEQKPMSESADMGQREQDRTDPALVDIWGQLNDELRHRETTYVQLIVSMFVFLGAAAAIVSYIPTLKWWVWTLGSLVIIVGWVYVRLIAIGQEKCHEAAMEVQRRFRLPDDVTEKLGELMHGKRQRISKLWVQLIFIFVTSGLWIYFGFVVVFCGS